MAAFRAAVATAAVLDGTDAAQVGLAISIVIAPAIAIAIEYIVIVVFMVISSRMRAPDSAANVAPRRDLPASRALRFRSSDVNLDRAYVSRARRDGLSGRRCDDRPWRRPRNGRGQDAGCAD